jgi:hypothetical protein
MSTGSMKPFATSWCRAVLVLILFLAGGGAAAAAVVTAYNPIFRAGRDGSGGELVLIRSFLRDGTHHYLAVDTRTLVSHIVPAAAVEGAGAGPPLPLDSPYLRSLARSTAPPYPLQNDGATRSFAKVAGAFLTVDLCPSGRPLERGLFTALAARAAAGVPVPVALAVSGRWLRSHQEELRWLRGEETAGRLAITWVNHSLSHPYDPAAPLERNFLLTPGIDLDREVLETERLLVEEGLSPSPFFRFPGLVSDQRTVARLAELGLIPLGSDAWLAKGESPGAGSFILVHGNGNEPAGVRRLLELQRQGGLQPLLPLAEAFRP